MTLTTRVATGAPIDHDQAFTYCRHLLGAGQDISVHTETPDPSWQPGQTKLSHDSNMGLPALMHAFYGTDGPMPPRHETPGDEHNPTCNGWSYMELAFDTSIGYRRGRARCTDLHAWLIRELGAWLDQQAIPWKWMHEYGNRWRDQYTGLDQFGNATIGALRRSPIR